VAADPEIFIHTAGEEDLPVLLELYRQLTPDDQVHDADRQRRAYRAVLNQPGLSILLGVREKKPVTTLTLAVIPNLTRGCSPYALIENVVTHSDHRGMGFGEKLMTEAIRRAWNAGCYKVMLLSGANNSKAHAFYERVGLQRSKTGFEIRRPGYPTRKLN
jgi:GNAT superfamily N-acetyltransferase